jgi:transposase InsO family protein
MWERVIRFRYMISDKAKKRVKILAFWEKYGDEATKEAFGVSRRTLFRWQKKLEEHMGKLEGLNAKSTAPIEKRKRVVPEEIINKIIEFRTFHPRIGKEKIHTLLKTSSYLKSVSTIGRIISDLKKKKRIPEQVKLSYFATTGNLIERRTKRKKKQRRPKGYRVLEVDTVVRFVDGKKRYIVTGTDTEKRTAFAACYTNHGSFSAGDFLTKCGAVLPDCPRAVQTDNGSEFALHFDQACKKLKLERFHTYPRSPKMNAHVERFNRTLDEEFLVYHRALMRDDVKTFNDKLVDWLLWYNGERPHHSLGLLSPFQAMMKELQPRECQMWWTYTCA